MISASVGQGGVNEARDVEIIQGLLNARADSGLAVDGLCGPATIGAIKNFQANVVGMAAPDGLVSPDGPTLRALSPVTPVTPSVVPSEAIPPDIIQAAQAAQAKYGVPAAISIAQWILESGRGAHMPPGSNNPFGIKTSPTDPTASIARTREVVNGQNVYINAYFKSFPSIAAAFDAHGALLANSGYYTKAMAQTGNPDGFADALTGVYATDPNYGTALKTIMQRGNLYQYDTLP